LTADSLSQARFFEFLLLTKDDHGLPSAGINVQCEKLELLCSTHVPKCWEPQIAKLLDELHTQNNSDKMRCESRIKLLTERVQTPKQLDMYAASGGLSSLH